jgi:uncharacterized protein YndB with AHSA1/START domain
MKNFSFQVTAHFPVSAHELFTLLTDSKRIKQWSGQKGFVRPTIGGKFELFDGWVKGTTLAYEPGKQLSYTWKPAEWSEDTQPSIVACTFTITKAGVKLLLKHSCLHNKEEAKSHKDGWNRFVFDPLKSYLSTR